MTEIIKRKDAKQRGLNKYFTGKQCSKGHTAERYVDSGVCKECVYNNAERYTKENLTKVRQYNKQYLKQTKYHIEYYAANAEKSKLYTRRWKANNPERLAVMRNSRGLLVEKATPLWYEEDLINKLYKKRDELSELWNIELTVDHIIPIKSDTVCGLHCWANLQLIDRKLNGQKHNKYETDW